MPELREPGGIHSLPKDRVKAPAEAVKEAEVVVIATPWSAVEAAVKSLGSLALQINTRDAAAVWVHRYGM